MNRRGRHRHGWKLRRLVFGLRADLCATMPRSARGFGSSQHPRRERIVCLRGRWALDGANRMPAAFHGMGGRIGANVCPSA